MQIVLPQSCEAARLLHKKKNKELCWQSIRGVLLTTSCASWALTYIPAGVVRTEAHYFTANEKNGGFPSVWDESLTLQSDVHEVYGLH